MQALSHGSETETKAEGRCVVSDKLSPAEKPTIVLKASELVRFVKLASCGGIIPVDVGRLVAEVFRLRAKCRGQQYEIHALRVERDALAALAAAYAPGAKGGLDDEEVCP